MLLLIATLGILYFFKIFLKPNDWRNVLKIPINIMYGQSDHFTWHALVFQFYLKCNPITLLYLHDWRER